MTTNVQERPAPISPPLAPDAPDALVLPAPPPPTPHRDRGFTLWTAWVLLAFSFLLFCTIVSSAGYSAWTYRMTATTVQQAQLIVRAPIEQITWQRCGRTVFERVQDGQQLQPCDRLRVDSSVGYGQAATLLLFDQSALDLWAEADVQLVKLDTTRWNNNQQQVVVRQYGGYVRYDLKADQPFEQVRFAVLVYDTLIELDAGGSYSIALAPTERTLRFYDERESREQTIDVAVREGSAQITSHGEQLVLQRGQRAMVDVAGALSPIRPAEWQLLRDGSFTAFTEEEYNNTTIPPQQQPQLVRADTWQVFSGPADVEPGFFQIVPVCPHHPAQLPCPPDSTVPAARFIRTGTQTSSFVTGIRQTLGVGQAGIDISEYPGLLFSIQLRVREQSLDLAGERGSECPVMVRFLHKRSSPLDAEQERVICFYTSRVPGAAPRRDPGIIYIEVERDTWHTFTVDLRSPGWIPLARYLRSVDVYANGHDYDVQVARVSLLGLQINADERYRMPIVVDPSDGTDDTSSR